jgi:hypothetical protein
LIVYSDWTIILATNDVSFRAFTLTQSNENDTENSSSPNVNFSMFGSTIDIVKVLNGIEQQIPQIRQSYGMAVDTLLKYADF